MHEPARDTQIQRIQQPTSFTLVAIDRIQEVLSDDNTVVRLDFKAARGIKLR